MPARLYRVEYWEGYGYPECYDRRRKKRTFDDADGVARLLSAIEKFPDHHRLIGVWVSDVHWQPTPAHDYRARSLADLLDDDEGAIHED